MKKNKKTSRILTKFRPKIRSRHPSHDYLRGNLPLFNFRSVIRFGSTTVIENSKERVEINSIEAIKNSSDKLRMKRCFAEFGVRTPEWYHGDSPVEWAADKYPIVGKHRFGSRGTGNTYIENEEQLLRFISNKTLSNYIFEKYYNYVREYRIHSTQDECFYYCRKMLKSDTPDNERWYRNDNNSIWVLPDNELFDKPANWSEIEEQAKLAVRAVGLDMAAVDIRVQSTINKKGNKRESSNFVILETNSAPGLGDIGKDMYKNQIVKMLKEIENESR